MRKLFVILILSAAACATCAKPSTPTGISVTGITSTSATLNWTTNVPASTRVVYGYTLAGSAGGNAGILSAETDTTTGVTTHSVTLTGLLPSTGYSWGIITEGVDAGAKCGAAFRTFLGGGDNGDPLGGGGFTTSAAPAGSATYGVDVFAGQHVTQGKGVYLAVQVYTTQGTILNNGLKTVVTGFPAGSTLDWKQFEGSSSQATTTAANDTYNWYQISSSVNGAVGNSEFHIVVPSNATLGNYTLTFTTSDQGANGLATVVKTFTLIVDSASAPYGIAFPFGKKPASPPAIPCLNSSSTTILGGACSDNWTDSMTNYGAFNCKQDSDTSSRVIAPNNPATICVASGSFQKCSWYYDGWNIYMRISEQVGDFFTWQQCRKNVTDVYRETYIIGFNGGVTQYTRFAEGFYRDWSRTGDDRSKTAVDLLVAQGTSNQSAIAVPVRYLQRETAYGFKIDYIAKKMGSTVTRSGQNMTFWTAYGLDHVLNHLDQVCVSQNAQYFENFMVGLEAQALLYYYEDGNFDVRIPSAIKACADYLYSTQWNTISDDQGAFAYDSYRSSVNLGRTNGGGSSMVALNNLISPMYAWLYHKTGLSQYQTEGDEIWQHGILYDGAAGGAFNQIGAGNGPTAGNSGKVFSEGYYWSFDYVKWRGATTPSQTHGAVITSGAVIAQ